MRIGELAKKTSLSRDTIRFYEKHGLVQSHPGTAKSNNYRDYPESNLLTLEIIGQAKAAGFTLAELMVFLSQIEASSQDNFDGEAFLKRKIDEVEDRIAQSRVFLKTLKTTLKVLASSP